MHRTFALLALTALTPACDDSDGSGGGLLSPGFYSLISRQFGPCGAPVAVTDCPECQVEGPLVQVDVLDFGGTATTFFSNCETDDECFVFGGGEGSGPKYANAQQSYFGSGGVCQYKTVDLEYRAGEAGTEIVLTTFGGELTEDECDRYFNSDTEFAPRDRLTCQSEEIALVAPR